MGMGIRLRAGSAFACCFFPCLHPLLLRGLPGRPARLPREPRCPCLHPLLHPCSGMRPALRFGESPPQMPLPPTPQLAGAAYFQPSPVSARLLPAPRSAQPHGPPHGCSRSRSRERGRMRPALAVSGNGASQSTSDTPGSLRLCQALPLSHPVTPRTWGFLPN